MKCPKCSSECVINSRQQCDCCDGELVKYLCPACGEAFWYDEDLIRVAFFDENGVITYE